MRNTIEEAMHVAPVVGAFALCGWILGGDIAGALAATVSAAACLRSRAQLRR